MTDDNGEQTRQHIARLKAHVLSGGTLDRANALWLIELSAGGIWGRMASRATSDRRRHRLALLALVHGLVTGRASAWTSANWRPLRELLKPREGDDLQYPGARDALLASARIDGGFRLVEPGELDFP